MARRLVLIWRRALPPKNDTDDGHISYLAMRIVKYVQLKYVLPYVRVPNTCLTVCLSHRRTTTTGSELLHDVTSLRSATNDPPLVQDTRIPTWDFGEIAGQSSCFSAFMRLLHIRSTVSFVLVLRGHIVVLK